MKDMVTLKFTQDYKGIQKGYVANFKIKDADFLLNKQVVVRTEEECQNVDILQRINEKYEKESKVFLKLPQNELDSDFAKKIAFNIKETELDIYWDGALAKVVEVNEFLDKKTERMIFGRKIVDPLRLKAILEKMFVFFIEVKGENFDVDKKIKSPNEQLLRFLSLQDDFREALKQLNYVSEAPYIYKKNNKICVANGGYNEDCAVFVRSDAPKIERIDISQAKQIINSCFIDFPFESEQDKVLAIASIITPMLRGLYGQYGVRTPVFSFLANQQGAGKDYLAGVRHLIYTGRFSEDAPLSNDKGSSSDEIQKEILTAAVNGSTFMHFSNCRGNLNNAAFEKHTTASSIRGRLLGTNTNIDIENVFEFSYSGNYGLTFNRDLARRSVVINLFTDVEDTTKRQFTKDLHSWILENRGLILSSVYSLIVEWFENGAKFGDGINASYPLWAKYISGIMQYHVLGDPTIQQNSVISDIGGDTETRNIIEFNREIGEWLENPENQISEFVLEHSKEGLTKKQIFQLYEKVFWDIEDKPFAYFDLNNPKDHREFGRTLNKYIGMIRGGYKIIVTKEFSSNRKRNKYKFTKINKPLFPMENTNLVSFNQNDSTDSNDPIPPLPGNFFQMYYIDENIIAPKEIKGQLGQLGHKTSKIKTFLVNSLKSFKQKKEGVYIPHSFENHEIVKKMLSDGFLEYRKDGFFLKKEMFIEIISTGNKG
jgi:hypothetical protein